MSQRHLSGVGQSPGSVRGDIEKLRLHPPDSKATSDGDSSAKRLCQLPLPRASPECMFPHSLTDTASYHFFFFYLCQFDDPRVVSWGGVGRFSLAKRRSTVRFCLCLYLCYKIVRFCLCLYLSLLQCLKKWNFTSTSLNVCWRSEGKIKSELDPESPSLGHWAFSPELWATKAFIFISTLQVRTRSPSKNPKVS